MPELSNNATTAAAQPTSPTRTRKGSNEHQFHLLHSATGSMHQPDFAKSGKLVVEWYLSLFSALSTLGTLGAGFTLSVVVLSLPDPDTPGYYYFSPNTVSLFAAISSILFVLTVLVSQGCAQIFQFEKLCIADGVDNDEALILWPLAGLSLLLQMQVLGAFLFLELVLTAHQPVVGWIGVALTAGLGAVALFLWGLQATGRKPVARYRRFTQPRRRRASGERRQESP